MDVKLTSISYNLDTSSNTTSIIVAMQGFDGRESINTSVSLVSDDVTEGQTLDDLGRKELEAIARTKTAGYITTVPETKQPAEV